MVISTGSHSLKTLQFLLQLTAPGMGAPGAFMSMLGSAYLNEIVNKEYITHPGVILRRMRKGKLSDPFTRKEKLGSQGWYGHVNLRHRL